MSQKTRQQIKDYLNQCGDLDYQEMIDLLDSVVFGADGPIEDISPICQVTRYKRFRDVSATIVLPGLFDKNTNLLGVYIFRKQGEDFLFKIGTTNGGNEILEELIDRSPYPVESTELFIEDTNLYLSGFEDTVCDVVVVYNSFECDDNGDMSQALLEQLIDAVSGFNAQLSATTASLQNQINALSNVMIQIPSGLVVQWNGTVDNIPVGWSLYEGNKNRFVIGAGGDYAINETGGAKEVTITVAQLPKHKFKYWANKNGSFNGFNQDLRSGSNGSNTEEFTNEIGNDQPHNNMPPFIAKIFIIKD